jgi:hypothetical protein
MYVRQYGQLILERLRFRNWQHDMLSEKTCFLLVKIEHKVRGIFMRAENFYFKKVELLI